jgi:hypothetical protein
MPPGLSADRAKSLSRLRDYRHPLANGKKAKKIRSKETVSNAFSVSPEIAKHSENDLTGALCCFPAI